MIPPLHGLKVLDFTTLLPGPMASAMLAAAGAAVTKIERPEGDDAARIPPLVADRSVLYDALNGEKTVLKLDLRNQAGCAEALRLAEQADIVLTQVRPGVMERLGLGYDDMRARKPDIIYCAITGYGQHGPLAALAGHDLNYLAQSGVLSAKAGAPAVPGGLFADVGGGTLPAVINILLALRAREMTGAGAYLDVSIAHNARAFIPHVTCEVGAGGAFDAAASPFGGTSPRYRLYECADGGFLAVAAIEDKFWRRFCALVGVGFTATATQVAACIARRTCAQWHLVFAPEDCCVSLLHAENGMFKHDNPLHLPVLSQFRRSKPLRGGEANFAGKEDFRIY